jgi:hypothetical protein
MKKEISLLNYKRISRLIFYLSVRVLAKFCDLKWATIIIFAGGVNFLTEIQTFPICAHSSTG